MHQLHSKRVCAVTPIGGAGTRGTAAIRVIRACLADCLSYGGMRGFTIRHSIEKAGRERTSNKSMGDTQ